MFMMKSNLIYSNLYSLGSSANNARNFNKIWPGPGDSAAGGWGVELLEKSYFINAGKWVGRVKKCIKHRKD